jgi:hypothetical protein
MKEECQSALLPLSSVLFIPLASQTKVHMSSYKGITDCNPEADIPIDSKWTAGSQCINQI